jgi:hypothetical protein
MEFGGEFHGFSSIAGLRDHFEVGLLIQQQPQAGPDDGVVVRKQDTNLWQVSRTFECQDTSSRYARRK